MPTANLGFSLIEILISFVLLSLMLLGLDMMQLASLREVRSAYYFAIADQQLKNMAEYLAMIKDNQGNQYLTLWNQQNRALLPQAKGNVRGNYPFYTISIFWGTNKLFDCKNKLGETGCLKVNITI